MCKKQSRATSLLSLRAYVACKNGEKLKPELHFVKLMGVFRNRALPLPISTPLPVEPLCTPHQDLQRNLSQQPEAHWEGDRRSDVTWGNDVLPLLASEMFFTESCPLFSTIFYTELSTACTRICSTIPFCCG
jgi:hypothetical protein